MEVPVSRGPMKWNKKRGDKVPTPICKALLSPVPGRGVAGDSTEEAEDEEHQGANMAVKWSSLGSGKETKQVVALS